MRGLFVVVASLLAGLGVYAIPNLMELSLLGSRLSPWFTCVLFADFIGCGILFLLGFRRLALGIYLCASFAEATILVSHRLPPNMLVWLTNLIPGIAVGLILLKAGLRTLVLDE